MLVIHLLVTWCTQGCSVWTIIVIIGKWAPGRAGYRVIINSIYSLLSPDSQLHTEPRPRLTSHNWNRSKKSGYNHNNWLRWDELYSNSEKERRGRLSECLFDHFSSLVTRSQARPLQTGSIHSLQSNSGRAWADKRGKHSNNHTRITSEEQEPASRLIWVTTAQARPEGQT